MPHLQDLWSEVGNERDDVAFLCVNTGDDKDVIAGYWEDDGFTLQAVRQQGNDVSDAFGVKAYPTNYVVDGDGKVVYRGVGWNEDAVREALASTD
jgi:hypothetical protein